MASRSIYFSDSPWISFVASYVCIYTSLLCSSKKSNLIRLRKAEKRDVYLKYIYVKSICCACEEEGIENVTINAAIIVAL